ncbi:hypothetical protein ACLB2K_001430 [Fragaria x ananassa]
MAETEDLPEEIILNIFSRLPVKSLIRFTSVSKRLHFIILSDPKFAQSQLKAAPRLSRRLLVSTDAPQLESLPLDADTPSFGDPSSVRKLTLPFLHQPGGYVQLLGSCNGLVFLSVDKKFYYVWNPSLGFVKKLPESYVSLSNRESESNVFYGVGYLSATDDYTVLAASYDFTELQLDITEDMSSIVEMFSLRTHTWERIESSVGFIVEPYCQGTLVNDALHWLNFYDDEQEIVCFDLAAKEFRGMWLPDFNNDGKSIRSLGVPDPPVWRAFGRKLLVVESSTFAVNWSVEGCQLIRIDHKENRKGILMCMVEYEESTLDQLLSSSRTYRAGT